MEVHNLKGSTTVAREGFGLVEEEQLGKKRAKYGKALLKNLSQGYKKNTKNGLVSISWS